MKKYDHKKIEKKWRKTWENKNTYKTESKSKKKKFYVLDMFPYPSGAGLHVGHPRGYIASDVYARFKRMQGFNVLHPMGFDSFGLPAEQYAIQTGKHPGPFTETLIKKYKDQLQSILFSYDWDREIATHRPEYYRWTQWIFLKLYEHYYDTKLNKAVPVSELVSVLEKEGNKKVQAFCDTKTPIISKDDWANFSLVERQHFLMHYRIAYEGYAAVNWCAELGTVLANDEIILDKDGKMVSERGGHPVVRKEMRQWFMRITAYADRLLSGLDTIDWSQSIKEIERNWIGQSTGSEIDFALVNEKDENLGKLTVFTTRADTIFGVTYVVLAPEHDLLEVLQPHLKNPQDVSMYIEKVRSISEQDRTSGEKEKTGINLSGIYAINPANNEKVPVWLADYVLASYGTGAVMGVPMHDERDQEFAKKYSLPITDRPLVDAKKITKEVGGKIVTKYKMRDAIFARQRYWGEPIPLRYDASGMIEPLSEKELPLELPKVKSYQPTGNGESPLSSVSSWVKAGYETNTMPGWAGSSWYFLRYMDPENKKMIASPEALAYWQDVDLYVGGSEHATGHLLYARFWHKFLKDIGVVAAEEPFKILKNQGMILATDGRKMSKRWGNVINPDDVISTHGADTMRVYESFMGPFESSQPWSTDSIVGARRFVERVWRLAHSVQDKKYKETDIEILKLLHKTIKKVTNDIQAFAFNTAVSSMMIWLNEAEKRNVIAKNDLLKFLQILAPFAPAITEEIWEMYNMKGSIHLSVWPNHDEALVQESESKIVIQVNGKVRAEMLVSLDATEEEVRGLALINPQVQKFIDGKKPKKIIYVKGKIL
ncbi:MAG: leucine--tRNA ligase, partial [Candidatus Paceibacteria bacterium]